MGVLSAIQEFNLQSDRTTRVHCYTIQSSKDYNSLRLVAKLYKCCSAEVLSLCQVSRHQKEHNVPYDYTTYPQLRLSQTRSYPQQVRTPSTQGSHALALGVAVLAAHLH